MPPNLPEVEFLRSPPGGLVVIVMAIAAFALTLVWARRPGRPDRRFAILAGMGAALVQAVITVIAVAAGWWVGTIFASPLLVSVAILVPFAIAGYTLWLGAYRWLAAHVRYGRLIFTVVVLAFVPIVVVADRISIARGQFSLDNGYTIWTDVVAGQSVLWSPVLFYELIRRRRAGVLARA